MDHQPELVMRLDGQPQAVWDLKDITWVGVEEQLRQILWGATRNSKKHVVTIVRQCYVCGGYIVLYEANFSRGMYRREIVEHARAMRFTCPDKDEITLDELLAAEARGIVQKIKEPALVIEDDGQLIYTRTNALTAFFRALSRKSEPVCKS